MAKSILSRGWAQRGQTVDGSLPPQRRSSAVDTRRVVGALVSSFVLASGAAQAQTAAPPSAPPAVPAPGANVTSRPSAATSPTTPPLPAAPNVPAQTPPLSDVAGQPTPTAEAPAASATASAPPAAVPPPPSAALPTSAPSDSSTAPVGTPHSSSASAPPSLPGLEVSQQPPSVVPPAVQVPPPATPHSLLGSSAGDEQAAEETAGSEPSAWDGFEYALLVDANYAISSSHRDALAPAHRAFVWAGADGGISNGFALEWFGADVAYRRDSLAVHASLRMGDGAKWLLRGRADSASPAPLAEAYLSWSPSKATAVELGQFRTNIGAESFDSFRNLNYSQGALYGLLQPWWHTGVRAKADFGSVFGVRAMLVNGANSTFDEDDAPAAALRFVVTPSQAFSFTAGAYRTFDTAKDTSGFDTVVDAVANLELGSLSVIVAGIVNQVAEDPRVAATSTEAVDTRAQPNGGALWGGAATVAYRILPSFRVAGRYEYLRDKQQLRMGALGGATNLHTGTLSLDYTPFESVSGFTLRWDNRVEGSNRLMFVNTTEEPSRRWFGSTLGFVYYTDNK